MNREEQKMKKYVVLLLTALCVLGMVGCERQAPSFSRSGFALNTAVAITVYDMPKAAADKALAAGFAEMERLEALLSATRQGSDIEKLNKANGNPVTISDETAALLLQAKQYSELSSGAFDVTIRPLTMLWDFSAESPTVPSAAALSQAAKSVDYRRLVVTETTAQLPTNAGVDLGGIAKGYIADCVRKVLQQQGVTSAIIDLGGNIVACGSKQGKAFRIGIKDPIDTAQLCAVISGQDISAVTSGVYERGFTIDGVRYHHLLNPKSGMPVNNGLSSVTIVCESSAQADALSTACFVMGEQAATELIELLDGVEALFVRTDGTMQATDGLHYEKA